MLKLLESFIGLNTPNCKLVKESLFSFSITIAASEDLSSIRVKLKFSKNDFTTKSCFFLLSFIKINSKTSNVFYLKVSINGLIERLASEKGHRPLIKKIADKDLPEFIGKHLFERNMFYLQAKHSITCDEKSPEIIVNEISEKLT